MTGSAPCPLLAVGTAADVGVVGFADYGEADLAAEAAASEVISSDNRFRHSRVFFTRWAIGSASLSCRLRSDPLHQDPIPPEPRLDIRGVVGLRLLAWKGQNAEMAYREDRAPDHLLIKTALRS